MTPPEEAILSDTPPVSLTARIIERQEHPIKREMLSQEALHVMEKLQHAGFSAYLVGGGVRDLYLDKIPKDFDISTDARPGQIRKIFPYSRTIGRRFRLVQVFFRNGSIIEVSTLRSLSEHDLDGPQAVLAPNNTYGTLDQDAQRRDLTINALFYEIEHHTIIDYVQGVEDLDRSIIRIVGEPTKRINRDPVRMMRAIRHAARNNFTIEEGSWQAICANHEKLRYCPPSRLRDETLKDIYSGAAAAWFAFAIDSGIFLELLPIYRQALSGKEASGGSCRHRLTDVFTAIDRISTLTRQRGASRQPEFFMLALILLPWVDCTYPIYSEKLAGATLFHTGKQIRADIDRELGQHLNLSRAIRQEIASLLTTLGTLIHNRQNDSWPKWLRRKKYFSQSVVFYNCYMEIISGQEVSEEQLPIVHNTHIPHSDSEGGGSGRHRKRPAFAPRAKNGIFGLKK
ncbi:MAG: polya polymerase [Desulfopila sp.]